MKVFVTGATGAVGRFVVPELVKAGHVVGGLARTDERAAQLEGQGARPARDHTETWVRAGRLQVGAAVGNPPPSMSLTPLPAAAPAVVAALDVPAGVYNVVDDEPLTKRDVAREIGAAVGKRPWVLLPGRLATLGGKNAEILLRSQRVSNEKLKAASGWAPAYVSAWDGWKAVVDA